TLAAGGGIAAVADAHPALQQAHAAVVEHVAHQAVALVHAQGGAGGGGDAGRVLAAVLEHGQAVVQRGRDPGGSDDADDAAHGGLPGCWMELVWQDAGVRGASAPCRRPWSFPGSATSAAPLPRG